MSSGIRWAMCLTEEEAHYHLPRMRQESAMSLCQQEGHYWLSWTDPSALEKDLRLRFGGRRLYSVDSDERIIPLGHHVPVGCLPEGPWHPLPQELPISKPRTMPVPRTAPAPCPVTLRRGGEIRKASLICCGLNVWQDWISKVPAATLLNWEVCFSKDSNVWIRGEHSLPPLEGERYSIRDGLALPLGFELDPPLPPSLLRRSCGTRAGDLLLFPAAQDHLEELPGDGWRQASPLITAWAMEQCHG